MDDQKNGSSSGTSSQKEADVHVVEESQHYGGSPSPRPSIRARRTQSRLAHPVLSWKKPPLEPAEPDAPRLPKRGQEVKCTLDAIMDKLKPFRHSGAKSHPNLELDSLADYGVDDADTAALRRGEAERFLAVIRDPQMPVAADALFDDQPYLQPACIGEGCYRRLSSMSQTISVALNLCLLDNECVNMQYCKRISNRERLIKYILRARVAAREEAPNCDNEDHREAVFALVDYISAIQARLISQTADGGFWLLNMLAALVARTAKIKFLLFDIVANAVRAGNAGQEVFDQMANKGSSGDFSTSDDFDEEECEEALRIIMADQKDGLTSEMEVSVASFCVNQNKYRSGLNNAMQYVLSSLRVMNLSGLPATTYEMCLLVYDIGFEGFKTVLFQDRDLEYSASSDRDVLNTTQSALIILHQILTRLQTSRDNSPQLNNQEHQTAVEWVYQDLEDVGTGPAKPASQPLPQTIQLHSLADIVAVMVPLAFTSPMLLAHFTQFRTMMALSGGVKDVVRSFREGQFGAYCRLYTKEFDQEAQNREILRLSQAFKQRTFSRCRLIDKIQDPSSGSPDPTGEAPDAMEYESLEKELGRCSIKMNGWQVDESSVTVVCGRYVFGVMSSAVALGAGGLTIGFTVGERIPGVDPFNLATYTWVLAAFVILICKAVLVESWAWSDFLQFKVRCKSVSELAATTGMDEQVIIAKLLHDDGGDSIMVTKGPFNSVFRRQSGSDDGFSINVKIKPITLILSGLAPLKVVTPRGHAIVCLDHRRGTFLAFVEHEGVKEKELLVCDELDRHITDWKAPKPRRAWRGANHVEPCKLHLTKSMGFKWKRVQGLCDLKEGEVVFV
ncbi:hypothetical protein B0T14DRAFT_526673 [Immersiella caudata]|uniref:Uncharacterized protein n=1 Tax=Immersiella caudata TaxID=314043 RepID=A0AA39WDZ9_9PEZI|nr:hypothetical protein B0T14DRAFT_526673 [Immersiella caudata]